MNNHKLSIFFFNRVKLVNTKFVIKTIILGKLKTFSDCR